MKGAARCDKFTKNYHPTHQFPSALWHWIASLFTLTTLMMSFFPAASACFERVPLLYLPSSKQHGDAVRNQPLGHLASKGVRYAPPGPGGDQNGVRRESLLELSVSGGQKLENGNLIGNFLLTELPDQLKKVIIY